MALGPLVTMTAIALPVMSRQAPNAKGGERRGCLLCQM
jgi:hypothetical protein